MKSESEVQQLIQAEASKYGIRLLRNNSGAGKFTNEETGVTSFVRFGLGNVSEEVNAEFKSSDLIGIWPVTITSDMVGMTLGVFTAIEVKKEAWKPQRNPTGREKAQGQFHQWVRQFGGFATFANSVDSFLKFIGK